MEHKIFISLLMVCFVCEAKIEGKKETLLQKHSSSTTPKILEAEQISGASTDGIRIASSESLKSHSATEVEKVSNTDTDGIKKTSTKTITAAVTYHNLKATGKKRLRTTPKTTTPHSTTETTNTETTTTEEPTTTETTTIESTTEESTTIETTTETTTIETTPETTTKSTVTGSSNSKSNVRPTPRLKSGSTLPAGNSSTPTKSWQKYVTKSTPLLKESSLVGERNTSSKELLKEATERTSPLPYRKVTKENNKPLTISSHKTTRGSSSGKENSNYHPDDGVNVKKTYTSAPYSGTQSLNESSTISSNSSVDIKIDIDIKLRSSVTSTSPGENNNTSVEYYNSSQAPYPTMPPKNREKHQERKKVVAGVILVVLISLSAAFAILFVLVPANSEVGCRRYHRRPDQVELIAPGRRYRSRYYDATLHMGH